MATIAPGLFMLTRKQKVMHKELAISSVTAFGYGSVLLSSSFIGTVARQSSLAVSLSLLCAAMLEVALCVKVLFRGDKT